MEVSFSIIQHNLIFHSSPVSVTKALVPFHCYHDTSALSFDTTNDEFLILKCITTGSVDNSIVFCRGKIHGFAVGVVYKGAGNLSLHDP